MRFLLFLLILVITLPAIAETPPPGKPEWYHCKQATDCVLLSGSSCTDPVAINSLYADEFITAFGPTHAKCGPAACDGSIATAQCKSFHCVVVRKPCITH